MVYVKLYVVVYRAGIYQYKLSKPEIAHEKIMQK